jgi:hypothetical protein
VIILVRSKAFFNELGFSSMLSSGFISKLKRSGSKNQYLFFYFYPYYLLIYPSLLTEDTNRLKEFLHAKIEKRKRQIHPSHNIRFNHDLQLGTDCIEWALKKIEVNKIPNNRLEGVN